MSRSSLLPALVFFLAACATSLGASPSRSTRTSTAGSRPKAKRPSATPAAKREQHKIEVRRPVDGPAGKDSARRLIARRHFQQGKVFLIRRQWERAIALLLKAYEYWDHPSVLYNLASAYAHMKDPMRARVYLRLYVKATSSDPERLPRLLAKVMEETAVLTIQIREAPPGVEVFVDGRRAGAMSTELVVQPGLRVVEIRLGSQVLRHQTITLKPGGEKNWEIDRVEPPPPPRPVVAQPAPARRAPMGRLHWKWLAGAGGASVALLVAAMGTSLATRQIYRDFQGEPWNAGLASEGRSMQAGANVLWGLSAVAVAATGVLALFTRWKRPEAPQGALVEPILGPGSVHVRVEW